MIDLVLAFLIAVGVIAAPVDSGHTVDSEPTEDGEPDDIEIIEQHTGSRPTWADVWCFVSCQGQCMWGGVPK